MAQARLVGFYNKDSNAATADLWTSDNIDSASVSLWHQDVLLDTLEINPDTRSEDYLWKIRFNQPAKTIDLRMVANVIISGVPITRSIDLIEDEYEGMPEVPNRDDVPDTPEVDEPIVEQDQENEHTDENDVERAGDHVTAPRPSEPVEDGMGDTLVSHVAFGEQYRTEVGDDVQYAGGGNRVYWDASGNLAVQTQDVAPTLFAYSEQDAENLIDNIWLSLTNEAPAGWELDESDVYVESTLVAELHPALRHWQLQLAKNTRSVTSTVSLGMADKVAISGSSDITFAALLNIRESISGLRVRYRWWNGNSLITQEEATFDAARFQNRWGMLAHTTTPHASATGVSLELLINLSPSQAPLVKFALPNIVELPQATSLILGQTTRLADVWTLPASAITPRGSIVELTATLGNAQQPGTLFDCRDGFGMGAAGIWDGTKLQLILNAGAGDVVLETPWAAQNRATWRFEWQPYKRSISVNGVTLVTDQTPLQTPTNNGTLLIAPELNCQLEEIFVHRNVVA